MNNLDYKSNIESTYLIPRSKNCEEIDEAPILLDYNLLENIIPKNSSIQQQLDGLYKITGLFYESTSIKVDEPCLLTELFDFLNDQIISKFTLDIDALLIIIEIYSTFKSFVFSLHNFYKYSGVFIILTRQIALYNHLDDTKSMKIKVIWNYYLGFAKYSDEFSYLMLQSLSSQEFDYNIVLKTNCYEIFVNFINVISRNFEIAAIPFFRKYINILIEENIIPERSILIFIYGHKYTKKLGIEHNSILRLYNKIENRNEIHECILFIIELFHDQNCLDNHKKIELIDLYLKKYCNISLVIESLLEYVKNCFFNNISFLIPFIVNYEMFQFEFKEEIDDLIFYIYENHKKEIIKHEEIYNLLIDSSYFANLQ